jgi:alkanesulfonate monooxygenase SsuD/methylene tetrahydromethanopterin reductase-like flavin-dependent oxidoreductase (luciferase family)
LEQIEALDKAGVYAYHLAEHHSPAVHSVAPSQNVFLAAASQRTTQLRFGPCIYVLPSHHSLRLIEEISMLDNLSGGRNAVWHGSSRHQTVRPVSPVHGPLTGGVSNNTRSCSRCRTA